MSGETVLTREALQKMQVDYFGQFLLDNARFLEEMYHKLKGETLKEEIREINGQKMLVPIWKETEGLTPMLNDAGIDRTMQVLSLSLTANSATGKMDDFVLRSLAFKTYILLVKEYELHYDSYGFISQSQLYMLAHLIFTNILLHLSKSTDMALLKELFSSYNIHEIRGNQPQSQVQEPSMTL